MKCIIKTTLLLSLATAVLLACFAGCAKKEGVDLDEILGPQAEFGDALYGDDFANFPEMEQNCAKQIVRGKVVSTAPASELNLAQRAVVTVTDVYKGRELKEITVVQLYDRPLEEGKEYLLFLALQYPDDPENTEFFTISGPVGQMPIDEANKTLTVECNMFALNDVAAWVNENAAALAGYKVVLDPVFSPAE